MEFCDNCYNYLSIREERKEDNFDLVYKCENCNFSKKCESNVIFTKIYKQEELNINDIYLNKYHKTDKTLPSKLTTCVKCNETNNNKYEVKYCNNSFNIIIYCSSCDFAFKYKK